VKNPQSKTNQQQTQSTYDALSRIRTRVAPTTTLFPVRRVHQLQGKGSIRDDESMMLTKQVAALKKKKTKENRSVGSTILFVVPMLQRLKIKNSNLVCDCTYD